VGHEFINYELEFDLNKPYISIEEDIICMLDGRGDAAGNRPIEVVGDVQIDDVLDFERALATLKQFWNKDLLMLHLSSKAFEHFKRK